MRRVEHLLEEPHSKTYLSHAVTHKVTTGCLWSMFGGEVEYITTLRGKTS
jgi:hypothetical protein